MFKQRKIQSKPKPRRTLSFADNQPWAKSVKVTDDLNVMIQDYLDEMEDTLCDAVNAAPLLSENQIFKLWVMCKIAHIEQAGPAHQSS